MNVLGLSSMTLVECYYIVLFERHSGQEIKRGGIGIKAFDTLYHSLHIYEFKEWYKVSKAFFSYSISQEQRAISINYTAPALLEEVVPPTVTN